MGEAEARLFAAEGAKVIVADILGSEAERVAADIRGAGGEATADSALRPVAVDG
jgi:NAD(P)-dependent dehydrogenase (short-subunit alcohol dehydrogenase family)